MVHYGSCMKLVSFAQSCCRFKNDFCSCITPSVQGYTGAAVKRWLRLLRSHDGDRDRLGVSAATQLARASLPFSIFS